MEQLNKYGKAAGPDEKVTCECLKIELDEVNKECNSNYDLGCPSRAVRIHFAIVLLEKVANKFLFATFSSGVLVDGKTARLNEKIVVETT